MSQPVFLTSSHLEHMPIGSQNQWSDFYHNASFELQADSFVPILWFMLFNPSDLNWAKYTDLLDHADPNPQTMLAEYQHDFAEHQYAYLVTDQDNALQNLEKNKAFFIESAGEAQLNHYDHFKQLIEEHYPEHILLRSSSMPIDFDSDQHLRFPLEQLEQFQQDPSPENGLIHYQKVALSEFDDYAYFFLGVEPNTMTQEMDHSADEVQELEAESTPVPSSSHSGMAVWICTAIVSILTLIVWFKTSSILYSFVVFIVSAFVLGFISSIMGKSKAETLN